MYVSHAFGDGALGLPTANHITDSKHLHILKLDLAVKRALPGKSNTVNLS